MDCHGVAELEGKGACVRILGIDPGLGRMGFGLVEVAANGGLSSNCWGMLTTPSNTPDAERLQILYNDLADLIETTRPDCVALERIFYFQNATTMVPVTQARGVIVLRLGQFNLPFGEYTPMQVKQAVAGHGKAKKPEVQQTVQSLLGLDKLPRPDDAADGLALAVCHYLHTRSLGLVATAG